MNNIRLTFNSSTNLTLPISTYRVLRGDAEYYGFVKNGVANISGFLNNLIPSLADYQRDLYEDLLKYNNGDEDIAKIAARNIQNVYLKQFTFHSDGKTSVPFRINRDKYMKFTMIHDEYLRFYDMDFTNYIRTLLLEYTSKTFSQREYLYAFTKLLKLKECVENYQFCKFFTTSGESEIFVPIFLDTSPVYDHNYIVGLKEDGQPFVMRLNIFEEAVPIERKMKVTKQMCVFANEYLDNIYQEELEECSD